MVHAGGDPGQDMRQDGPVHMGVSEEELQMGVFCDMGQGQAEYRMILLG